MKKVLSLVLVLALCLTLSACGNANNKAEIAAAICKGEWVSSDHIDATAAFSGFETHYLTLIFFENGICEYTYVKYKDGNFFNSGTMPRIWKIEKGKIVVGSIDADSDTDYEYYEYSDDVLTGNAWYNENFTYTHIYN